MIDLSRARLRARNLRRRSARRRRRALGALALFASSLLLLSLRPAREPVVQAVPALPSLTLSSLELRAAPTVLADRVRFFLWDVRGEKLPAGLDIRLSLATPAGPYTWLGRTREAKPYFDVPYLRAGTTPYQLTVAGRALEGSFTKLPGEPLAPLNLKLGPRTVRVTGDRLPALVVHPLDAQQNVTRTPLAVTAKYPDASLWRRQIEPDRLVVWTLVPTGERTGRLVVSAVTADKRGEQAEVDLVPGVPESAHLFAVTGSAPASGRDAWEIELSSVRDRLGNRVADGTALSFTGGGVPLGETDVRNFFATRPAVQGGLALSLPSTPLAGSYALQLVSGAFGSEPVQLNATRLSPRSLNARLLPGRPLRLTVGPVLSELSALVDDGTPVSLRLLSGSAPLLTFSEALEQGWLTWPLPPLPASADALEICVGERCERLLLAAEVTR